MGEKNVGGLAWLWQKISMFLDFVCAFLEVHLVKIVSFAIMALCCSTVNALHFIVVVTVVLCLLFGTAALRYSFSFIGSFLSVLFLAKMAYQTKFVPPLIRTFDCSVINGSFYAVVEVTILDPEWWGFVLLKEGETVLSTYKGYIFVFLVMTFKTVIRTRQKITRIDAGELPKVPHVVYMTTTRKDADKSLRECLKYLINYGFYKFGVEITLSYCVFVIVFRMDVFSVLYAIWLAILFLPRRYTLSVLWPFFFMTLVVSILWQYAMAVAISKKSCYDYPWAERVSLVLWLFLPSFKYPPDTNKTLVDFVLLILIQRQLAVFELERKYGDRYLGGSNKEVYMDYYNRDFVNPTPDHTNNIRSWLEVAKFVFMSCLFRITLAFEFLNGASNANVLSLGYLVGAFVFLWIDYDLCLWHLKKILKWWNILLGYTVFVIFANTLLEFAGCIYLEFLTHRSYWLVELLFLRCSHSPDDDRLTLQQKTLSLYWDLVCFVLVIFQKRYFRSYYFLHEMDDVLGVYRLQAKGAKLMDELQENKLKEFQLRERKTLMKIKKNMNRIKAWQKRMQGLNYNEPTDHATAIYMGDYLMFEELDNVSTELDDSSSSSDEYEYDEGGRKKQKPPGELTMSEFIGTVFKRAGDETSGKLKKSETDVAKEKNADYEKRDSEQQTVEVEEKEKKKQQRRRSLKRKQTSDGEGAESDDTNSADSDTGKFKKAWALFISFLDSIMVSMIRFFNKQSKDYRRIEAMMTAERKQQKKTKRDSQSERSESSRNIKEDEGLSSSDAGPESTDDKRVSLPTSGGSGDDDDSMKKSSQALLVNLINSICMFIMSKTELLCHVIIFLHTVLSPTLISLPLPLLVFLWGSLTTIRPTTTFWTVLIAYTEVTVVIKALFQNSIFPWNTAQESQTARPEYPPLFLGIHRDNQFVIADLFLLLLLFLHRYKLKTLGLWNRSNEEETLLPQNLKVYKELPSERDFKDIKGNRSLVHQRKRLTSEVTDPNDSIAHFLRMATWKCTSRATAKFVYWGNKVRTKIKIKEIEGPILVTHDGRRLQPTSSYVNHSPEDAVEGNVVLRVYINDIITDTKSLLYRLSWVQHLTSLRKFFVQILVRDWRVSADFYTLMFVFEFFNFLLIFFGYSSFTQSELEVSGDYFSLAENQVPIMYLITMIIHFIVIIIDRILYLRKSVIGKVILQFILVIAVHVWMFVLIPIFTDSPFNYLMIPQTYYIMSCFYFLMSAYQLRVGYPMRIQGHFLCKKYGYLHYYAYKGLQLIPFFNQLRTLLDFICIHTSMTMMEWIKMESIFQIVYENKCSRRADITYPVPRGQQCPKRAKYPPGILVLCGLIIIIWLPFIAFALFNTVAEPNLPQEASLSLEVGNFGEVYMSKASFLDIITLSEVQFKSLLSIFKDNRKVWAFMSLFDYRDVAVLRFTFEPYKPWSVTPQQLSAINTTFQKTNTSISLYLTWHVQRLPRSQIVANSRGFRKITLAANTKPRKDLADAILLKNNNVHLKHFLPKFIHVTNDGEAQPVIGFLSSNNHTNPYRNVDLSLGGEGPFFWWKFVELADDKEEAERISKIPFQNKNAITMYTFNEKNIPKLLLNISKKGIIGLYLSIVFVSWTFVKRLMWKYPLIMFDDMPNPDPVLKLCHDIYLARESHEFALEEDLYAKLLFLFRSPETMIQVTRLNTKTTAGNK